MLRSQRPSNFLANPPSHNQFPSDTPFPQVNELSDRFKELCAIIAKYDAPFQLQALHQHSIIPKGQVLLSTSITGLGY
jgi:hypothetical protein